MKTGFRYNSSYIWILFSKISIKYFYSAKEKYISSVKAFVGDKEKELNLSGLAKRVILTT